jgi:ABC-type multidrug transport system ATPase subunit
MKIITENLGKKFMNEWIFKNVNLSFESNHAYTFTGANGSGKSTLLQVLSGFSPQSEGKVNYFIENKPIDISDIFKEVVISAPYLELVEDFTLSESIDFHQKFKPLISSFTTSDLIDFIELPKAKNKEIKFFSSGMKQRVKLGLAFLSDCKIMILDEPTSNLDAEATAWYLKNVEKYSKDKILLIGSNQPNEYEFCKNVYSLHQFKV